VWKTDLNSVDDITRFKPPKVDKRGEQKGVRIAASCGVRTHPLQHSRKNTTKPRSLWRNRVKGKLSLRVEMDSWSLVVVLSRN